MVAASLLLFDCVLSLRLCSLEDFSFGGATSSVAPDEVMTFGSVIIYRSSGARTRDRHLAYHKFYQKDTHKVIAPLGSYVSYLGS